MVNATSWLLAPRDADARGVFVVSCAMREWRYAWQTDATYAATPPPSPVIDHVVPAPVVTHAARAPVFEYLAPAPVIEYIAPALATTYAVPSQQLPPAYTMTTVTTDVNFDTTSLVDPQFSIAAVEASAPLVVGSLPPCEEFDALVYNQMETIVTTETTQNIIENPAVQEQVIVQEIPLYFCCGADTGTNC